MACLKLQLVFGVDRPSGIRVNANKDGKLLSVDSREAELVVLGFGDLDALCHRAQSTKIVAKALHDVGDGRGFDREIQVDINPQGINPGNADLSVSAEKRGGVLKLVLKPGLQSIIGNLTVQNVGTPHSDCDPEALHRLWLPKSPLLAKTPRSGPFQINSRSCGRACLRPAL